MSTDKLTTALGAVGAIAGLVAAQGQGQGIDPGVVEFAQVLSWVCVGVMGFYTNKRKPAPVTNEPAK